MAPNSVTVVIPAYRAARTIGRAVDSVLAQTRAADEVLVVDDGSPDDLAAALLPYQGRVKLLRKPNGGVASARNHGLDNARGELIAFLDADDFWEPDKLARQVSVFESHPDVVLVASQYYTQYPGSARECSTTQIRSLADHVIESRGPDTFELATKIWTSTVMVRRSAVGQTRFDSQFEPAEDRDFWLRVALRGGVFLISEPLATAVLEPGSLSRKNVRYGYEPMVRVARQHASLLGRRRLRGVEARIFRAWAAAHLRCGQPRAALVPAWQRLCRQPASVEGWWVLLKSAALGCSSPAPMGD